MKIYKLVNACEVAVGSIEIEENKIIVYNQCFTNEFTNMYDALLHVTSNKLTLIPIKDDKM